jgi:malate permease and related proteins
MICNFVWMADLLLIPVCIGLGFLFARIPSFPEKSHKAINSIIIYLCLPALTLYYIPQIDLKFELIYPALVIWIIFLLSVPFFIIAEKVFKWDRKTTGALILTGGLANTSFVGFPVLVALFGEESLKTGVIIDQAGSFLVLSTLGVVTASIYSSGTYSIKKIGRDIIKYPSFIAFVVSIILMVCGFKHNTITSTIFQKLGSPTIILALVSVGMQLKIKKEHIILKELFSGLIYKLILAPTVVFLLFVFVFRLKGMIYNVSVIESAMPPMVMGSVLAVQFNLNPRLANMMVGIGILISVLTLSLWYYIVMLT